MIENLLCLAVILRSSFENGRDPRGHPVGSPLDLFKPWSMAAADRKSTRLNSSH